LPGRRLHQDRGFGDAEAGAAEFFWYQRCEPAELGKFLHEGFRIGFLGIDVAPIGVGKFSANFFDLCADLLLLGGQVEIHYFPL